MSATINYPERYQYMQQAIARGFPDRSIDHTQGRIEQLTPLLKNPIQLRTEYDTWRTIADLLIYLNQGLVRAAEPVGNGNWQDNLWVRYGIRIGFGLGGVVPTREDEYGLSNTDRPAFPSRRLTEGQNVRIVEGAFARTGNYLGDGVTIMPPSFVNVGAYVDRGTMIDSKVLVGTCAQIGVDCHLSMDASVGGVIEPPQAKACIVSDKVTMFAGTKIAEGVQLEKGVILAMNASLASSIELHDLVERRQIFPVNGRLIVPENAVVIPGSAPIRNSEYAREHGFLKGVALIVKYRDSQTDAKTIQDELLRVA